MLRRGIKQSCRLVVEDTEVGHFDARRVIYNRVHIDKKNIQEVYIRTAAGLVLLYKKEEDWCFRISPLWRNRARSIAVANIHLFFQFQIFFQKKIFFRHCEGLSSIWMIYLLTIHRYLLFSCRNSRSKFKNCVIHCFIRKITPWFSLMFRFGCFSWRRCWFIRFCTEKICGATLSCL